MIKLTGVNKYYNRRKQNEIHVIDNTSVELPDSGIVTMLGPSGCGKTTLLNAIGGLDKVDSGSIYIDDQLITRRSTGKIDDIRNARIFSRISTCWMIRPSSKTWLLLSAWWESKIRK